MWAAFQATTFSVSMTDGSCCCCWMKWAPENWEWGSYIAFMAGFSNDTFVGLETTIGPAWAGRGRMWARCIPLPLEPVLLAGGKLCAKGLALALLSMERPMGFLGSSMSSKGVALPTAPPK